MRGGGGTSQEKHITCSYHRALYIYQPIYLHVYLMNLKLNLCCSIDSFPQDLRGQPGLQEAGGDPSEAVQGLREDRLPAGQTSLLNILQVDRWINRSIDI